jgi:ABC-type iron transport system FetAB permease component
VDRERAARACFSSFAGVAVLVQLALMWIILGAVVVTTATTALAGTRRLFTDDQRLVRLTREST